MYLLYVLTFPILIWYLSIFILEKTKLKIDYNEYSNELNYSISKIVCGIIFSIFLLIILISNLTSITNQRNDFENIKKLEKQKQILEKRYNIMSVQLGSVLVDKYPDMEKEIFNNMNKDNTLFFVKYPELRSSETIINYSNKILELKDDIYNKELLIEEINKKTNYRHIDPWIFNSLIPKK